jgi:O-antigen/teichoic acid export membrane protein
MRAMLQNLASVICGEAAVRAANFLAVLVIARKYGQTTLGAYALSLAVVTIVVMFADCGLQTTAITLLSPTGSARNHILGRLTVSKTMLLVVAVAILAALQAGAKQAATLFAIGSWVTVRAVLQSYSQLQMAALKSVSLAKWIGIVQFLHSAVLVLGIWFSYAQGWSIFALLGWMAASQLLEVLLGFTVLARAGVWPRWPVPVDFFSTVKAAAPFGIAYGLANLIVRADTIVLSFFAPLSQIGSFSAANSILLVIYVCSWLFGSILLPEMVRLAGNPEHLRVYTQHWVRRVTVLALPASLLLSFAAPKAIPLLFGSTFAHSGLLAAVMALACPFIFLNSIYTTLTIATNFRASLLQIYSAATIATVVLDLIFARTLGSMGIAIAIVLREMAMLSGFWLLSSRLPLLRRNYIADFLPEGIESNPRA